MNRRRKYAKEQRPLKKRDIHTSISSLISRGDKLVLFRRRNGIERDRFIDRDVFTMRLWEKDVHTGAVTERTSKRRWCVGRGKGRTDFTRQFLPCCRSDGEGDGGVRRSGVPLFSFPLRPVCVKAAFPRCQAVCGYAVLRDAARVSTLWSVAIWLGKYWKYLFKESKHGRGNLSGKKKKKKTGQSPRDTEGEKKIRWF